MVAAVFGLGVATVGVVARQLPVTNHAVLVAAVLSPFLMAAAPLALGFCILAVTGRLVPAVCVICVAVAGVLGVDVFGGESSQASTEGLLARVMTANMKVGLADPEALVANARSRADVIALQEITLDSVGRLKKAGLDESFPFSASYPREDASGIGIWSRYPIAHVRPVGGFDMAFISARIRVSSSAPDVIFLVAHLPGPWPQPLDLWRRDIALLSRVMRATAECAGTSATVVVGDLNSTSDMRPFRQLLANGYTDASDTADDWRIRTYPQESLVPPLLAIDHVLIRNGQAMSAETVPSPGSDHLALIATVSIPRL